MAHKIFAMSFASVYPLYVTKLERKGRSEAELREVIRWLFGYSEAELDAHLAAGSDFATVIGESPLPNPARSLITGTICGIRVEEIDDPVMREIRYLDKLVDELAKGRPMERVLRKPAAS